MDAGHLGLGAYVPCVFRKETGISIQRFGEANVTPGQIALSELFQFERSCPWEW
jgi:hypothetical protein